MAKAFQDPLIKRIVPRYLKVAENETWSNFQIAKRIVFDFSKDMTSEELWDQHTKLMGKLREIRKVCDKKKINLKELETPEYSLLDLKIILTRALMEKCGLCERKCNVKRLNNEKGECRVGSKCSISSEQVHLGEEAHIIPSHTIFFMGCNFKCQYCQNWSISQWFEEGQFVTSKGIAESIRKRREEGCRNVNFVGGEPTPNLLTILESLKLCKPNIPVIWNSNFYMSEQTVQILDGIVDLYLPDFKYGRDECALRLSKIPDYFAVVSRNHILATKQAEVTVRHLVLPNHVECCSKPVLKWIAENIRDKCIVNIMDQYRPYFKAMEQTDVNRRITGEEFKEVLNYATALGINYLK